MEKNSNYFVHMVEQVNFFFLSLSRTIGATRLRFDYLYKLEIRPEPPPTPPSYDLFFFLVSHFLAHECFVVRPVLTLIHWGYHVGQPWKVFLNSTYCSDLTRRSLPLPGGHRLASVGPATNPCQYNFNRSRKINKMGHSQLDKVPCVSSLSPSFQ